MLDAIVAIYPWQVLNVNQQYLPLRVDININYISRTVANLSAVSFFVNRVINVWNNLPQDTDFSSFNLFKCAIENMDLSQYLKYDK